MVNQHESPFMRLTQSRPSGYSGLLVFPDKPCISGAYPSYPSGHWLFGFASKNIPDKDFDQTLAQSGYQNRYYNTQLHIGCFALPNYVEELLEDVEALNRTYRLLSAATPNTKCGYRASARRTAAPPLQAGRSFRLNAVRPSLSAGLGPIRIAIYPGSGFSTRGFGAGLGPRSFERIEEFTLRVLRTASCNGRRGTSCYPQLKSAPRRKYMTSFTL